MEEKTTPKLSEETKQEETNRQVITEKEAKAVRKLFKKYLASYKKKDPSMTDAQWLEQLFKTELPEISNEEAKTKAEEIIESISEFDENLNSVNEAAENGVSKEKWLADKIQEAAVGVSVTEFGNKLNYIDEILEAQNDRLHTMLEGNVLLKNNSDVVSMNKNLDGFIAEDMIAATTNLDAQLQGKNVHVDVLKSHNANSVDVRATDLTTGKYQNYQLKFGKDAKATIKLIENGNYNNQRIIVPAEQLPEVREYFKAKGSDKTITDHIEIAGVKGKSLTKQDAKNYEIAAQENGILPEMDYNHYQTKALAMNIGKNVGVMSLQSAAVSVGFNVASKILDGEKIDSDELVEVAIKTGSDTAVKTVTAGTLEVAVRKGIIKLIPKSTPAGIIANVACVGIENAKILYKIAKGELTLTQGLDRMGRTTVSMAGGLFGAAKGLALGAASTAWIPVVGPLLGAVTGFIGGTVGYFAGSKVGDLIYNAHKKVASVAKGVAKAAYNGLKKAGRAIGRGLRRIGRKIFG